MEEFLNWLRTSVFFSFRFYFSFIEFHDIFVLVLVFCFGRIVVVLQFETTVEQVGIKSKLRNRDCPKYLMLLCNETQAHTLENVYTGTVTLLRFLAVSSPHSENSRST